MAFKKGNSKVPGSGRKKGILNKRSAEARAVLDFHDLNVIDEWARMYRAAPEETLEDRYFKHTILNALAPYVYPKLTTIKVEKTPEDLELENMSDEEVFEKARAIVLQQGVGYVKELEGVTKSRNPKKPTEK